MDDLDLHCTDYIFGWCDGFDGINPQSPSEAYLKGFWAGWVDYRYLNA